MSKTPIMKLVKESIIKIIVKELTGEKEYNPKMNMTDQQINDLAQDIADEITSDE